MKEYFLLAASAVVGALVNARGSLTRRAQGGAPRRILVIKLDHVGDVVLATPAIRALREGSPDAVIDVLVSPESRFVVEGNPCVTRTLVVDSPRFRRPPSGGPASPSLAQSVTGRYDTVVELRGDEHTLWLPFRVGASRRVDRGTNRAKGWLARRLPGTGRARVPVHEVETNLAIVKPLLGAPGRGIELERARVEIHTPDAVRASARAKVRAAGGDPDRSFVCIHPGASWAAKAWSAARFGAVAAWIRAHYDAQVFVLGSESERAIDATVRSGVRKPGTIGLAGALTMDEVAALLVDAKLFLGNDGGPAHLAAAAGAPTLVLFGPTDPRRFRPWSARTTVLRPAAADRPGVRIEDLRIDDIEVDDVTAAIARMLELPAQKPAAPPGRAAE